MKSHPRSYAERLARTHRLTDRQRTAFYARIAAICKGVQQYRGKIMLPLLLLACAPVWGVPPCYPWEASASQLEATTQPANPVVWISATKTEASFVVTWFCDGKYKWVQTGFWGWRKNLRPDWIDTIRAVYGMDRTQLESLWRTSIKCELGTEETCGDYTALQTIAKRQWDATRPPLITWTVRPSGSATSRPVYRINANGTRNTTAISTERVAVGAECRCLARVIEEPVAGSDAVNSWCSVEGAENVATPVIDQLPERVTWCVRQ